MRQVEIWNQGNLKVSWNLGIYQQCNIAATNPAGQDVSSIGGETQYFIEFLQGMSRVNNYNCLIPKIITATAQIT